MAFTVDIKEHGFQRNGVGGAMDTTYAMDTIQTGLPQVEEVERLKKSAHKHGFYYRSRKMKDGSVKLTLIRRDR